MGPWGQFYQAIVAKCWHTEFGTNNFTKDIYQGLISPTCLRPAFTHADTKSAKIQSSHQCLFARLGSAHKKLIVKRW